MLAIRAMSAYGVRVMPSSTFADTLRSVVERFDGEKQAFAKKAEITPSTLSRLLGGETPPLPETCLRIAHAGGVSPSRLLRAAGHGRVADLFELLYGPGRVVFELKPDEKLLVLLFRQLGPRERKAVLTLIRYNLAEVAPATRRRRRRRRGIASGIPPADQQTA